VKGVGEQRITWKEGSEHSDLFVELTKKQPGVTIFVLAFFNTWSSILSMLRFAVTRGNAICNCGSSIGGPLLQSKR